MVDLYLRGRKIFGWIILLIVITAATSRAQTPPVALGDTTAVTQDIPATGNVLTNDTDPEGDALTASLVTAPVNGTVVLNADGSFTYTPNAGFSGRDSLIYQVCDNGTPSLCDTAAALFNVKALAPAVTDVSATTPNGAYTTGDNIRLTVTFNQPVIVTTGGTPTLLLETGPTDRKAAYIAGSNTNTITFSYTVQTNDQSPDLDYVNTGSLALNGSTIRNATGTNAVLTLPATGSAGSIAGNKNIVVDAVAPVIDIVAVPANGTYTTDQNLNFTVQFSEQVEVNTTGGTPFIPVTIGSKTVHADYISGGGTDLLTFRYKVKAGEQDADGITLAAALNMNGGTIGDAVGNDADPALNNIAPTTAVLVDALVPAVTSVTIPANGTYKAGDVLHFTVLFSEDIVVNGTPSLQFTIGSTLVNAAYLPAASGADMIAFSYTVQPGQEDPDGITLNAIAAGGATIRDNAGNNAVLTLVSVPDTKDVLVDAVNPVVSSVTVPANDLYKAGGRLDYTVSFSEKVFVNTAGGDPTISLEVGSTTRILTYVSGTGTTALLFRYTVQAGDLDANGVQCGSALLLNGSTVTDNAGNPAVNTLYNVGAQTGVKVDAVVPVVTAGQVFTIAENSPAATVAGTVAATDAGAVLPLQQFTITTNANPDGDANPAFSIDPATGVVTVNDADDLDYEKNASLTIAVTVSDGVNASAVETVRINLTNVPEPPLDIELSNLSVFENNAVNAVIGALSATSAETGVTFTYTLVTGAGSTDNAAFNIAGSNLRAGAAFNFETKTAYNIRVRATTGSGEYLEKAFLITVNDVNEAPAINAIDDQSFCALTTTQTIPLTGITTGPDAGQSTSVTVTSDNAGLFTQLTADNNSLQFRFAANANGSANVTVTVKDDGGTANGGVDQTSRTFKLSITSIAAPTISSNKGTKVSKGLPVELTAAGGVTYVWDDGPGIISGQNSATLVIRPEQNATYTVTASNAAGCTATGQIDLEVIEDYKVDGVNLITPNGDGINDRFLIKNIDSYPNNEVKIFDRSGRLIYNKRGYQNEWDGRINGRTLEEGTYYYILDFGTDAPEVKGFITIIRDK